MPSLAARPRRSPRQAALLGAGLFASAIVLMVVQARAPGPFDSARDTGAGVLTPFMRMGAGLRDGVAGVWMSLFQSEELIAENDALREQLAQLHAERAAASSVAAERADTGRLGVALPEIATATIAARVLAPVPDGRHRRLWIDRGADDGLREGQTVLGTQGVIGVLREVHEGSAIVQLLSDEESRWGAEVLGRAHAGVVSGTGDADAFELRLERTSDEVEAGDAIVTSGRRGSTVPAGLPLGKVARVDVDGTGERRVLLEPLEDAESLRHVYVLDAPQLAWEPPR